MRTKHMVAPMGLVALAIVLATGPLQAQTAYYFQRISAQLHNGGYGSAQSPIEGWLREDQSTSFNVWITANRRYLVAAACDEDCSDLDLELVDPDGVVVDRDFDPDDEPVVGTVADRSGMYRVRVFMPACSRQPCRFIAGVFRR